MNAVSEALMGEHPAVSYGILNAAETDVVISFDSNAAWYDALDWLAEQKRLKPGYVEREGLHIVRYEVCLRDLGETAARHTPATAP